MLKYMLDTNIVIYTMKQRPIEVKEKFNLDIIVREWQDIYYNG